MSFFHWIAFAPLSNMSWLCDSVLGLSVLFLRSIFLFFNENHTKVMLKILQARLQQYVNRELPDIQSVFRKGRGTSNQIANICWIIERWQSFRKTSTSLLLTMAKPLTVWLTINCGKVFKKWEYQTTWPASWETYMQARKQQLELDTEEQTGSK